MNEHDLIVIGLGPGGEEVAQRAAEAGLDVLGIDRRLVGGSAPAVSGLTRNCEGPAPCAGPFFFVSRRRPVAPGRA